MSCGSDGYCYGADQTQGSCGSQADATAGGPDGPLGGDPDGSNIDRPDGGGGRPDADVSGPDACSGPTAFADFNAEVIAIPDNDLLGITSDIVADASCVAVETVQVNIDITHTFRGDLSIALISPGGGVAPVLDPSSDGANDIHEAFDVVIATGENASGTWTLSVADTAAGDIGTLDRWSIGINRPAP